MTLENYLNGLLGEDAAQELITAMEGGKTIIVSGPQGPTGKSTLCQVLNKTGVSAIEWHETHEVALNTTLGAPTPQFADLITV